MSRSVSGGLLQSYSTERKGALSWYQDFEDLDSLIVGIIDAWRGDRDSDHAEQSEVAQKTLKIVDDIAQDLLKTSEHMLPSSNLQRVYTLGKLPSASLEEIGVKEIALESIQVEVAWEYCTGTRQMAERVLELSDQVVFGEPNKSVRRFLRRLSRAYVVGLFPECVILCRAVMEGALGEKFQLSGVPAPEDEKGRSDLKVRIDAAERFGWITADDARAAHDVRIRGNKALHDDPLVTADAWDTLRKTMTVLRSLYRN